ncbi:hypothetical protein VR46_37070, partial [Streptomyces sp. NRRL S-444]
PWPSPPTTSASCARPRTANPNTVLARVSAYPYAVDHAGVPALLWTAHGGQASGTALALALAGDVSPSGRLPQTWYADDSDPPGLLDYDVGGSRQTYLCFEGTPVFPFGPGLSYASFSYEGLTTRVEDGTLQCPSRSATPVTSPRTRSPSSAAGPWSRRCHGPAGNWRRTGA